MCSAMANRGMVSGPASPPPGPRRCQRRGPAPGTRDRRSGQRAGILLLRRLDELERFVRLGDRLDDLEDVPLVPGVLLVLDLDHVHLLQELVVPVAEAALPGLE